MRPTIWLKAAEYVNVNHCVACAALSAAGASMSDLDLFAEYFKPPRVHKGSVWWPHPFLCYSGTDAEKLIRTNYRVFALLLMHEITKGNK
jgi:hypothetical protein